MILHTLCETSKAHCRLQIAGFMQKHGVCVGQEYAQLQYHMLK